MSCPPPNCAFFHIWDFPILESMYFPSSSLSFFILLFIIIIIIFWSMSLFSFFLFLGNLYFKGAIWEIYDFWNQLYEIWEPTFNMESNIVFLHFELAPFFCIEIALSGLQVSSILESMLASSEIEQLKNTKIKIWSSELDHTNFPKTSCFHFALTPLCFQPTTSLSGPSFGSHVFSSYTTLFCYKKSHHFFSKICRHI